MKIVGKLCDRIDTIEGKEAFKANYDIEPFEFLFENEIFNISRLFSPTYEYIVFLEYDAVPRQVFYIEPKEHIMVYNDIVGEIFNTDSMAFFSLIREGTRIATFCTEHSPWSFTLSDQESLEEMDVSATDIIDNINNFCEGKELSTLANMENTLLIRNL